MISYESPKPEIEDLQRLLISLNLLVWSADTTSGEWGDETQAAVVAGYAQLNWSHPADGRWISAAALAALAAGWGADGNMVCGTSTGASRRASTGANVCRRSNPTCLPL